VQFNCKKILDRNILMLKIVYQHITNADYVICMESWWKPHLLRCNMPSVQYDYLFKLYSVQTAK